jgi:hypothetical protein
MKLLHIYGDSDDDFAAEDFKNQNNNLLDIFYKALSCEDFVLEFKKGMFVKAIYLPDINLSEETFDLLKMVWSDVEMVKHEDIIFIN